MFYQNGHQPYGQQPSYPQQQQQNAPLHHYGAGGGGYNGGGGGAPSSSSSGEAILEFPSPYGPPPPLYGGGYASPSGPPQVYGAQPQQQPQQQSTYAAMPHFSPQQPQPQPSGLPPQQAPSKPLFQPSGMIRSRKPVSMSAPMEAVLSPPSSANSAVSPSSPIPPLAASASMPVMPTLSSASDYEDYSQASAPPHYHAYTPPVQQIYGQAPPPQEYQMTPDYRMSGPPYQQQQQQQRPLQPTPYHNMPVFPQRIYTGTGHPGEQQQQQQHYSSPQIPHHYQSAPLLSQPPQQHQSAAQPQPQQQKPASKPSETEAKPAAVPAGTKVPPLAPIHQRNSANISPKHQQKDQQPQRVASEPLQLSELEEKLRDRAIKAKRRESAIDLPRRQLAGLSLNTSAPTNAGASAVAASNAPQKPNTSTADADRLEKRRRGVSSSALPQPGAPAAPLASTTSVEDLYAAPASFVLQPESRQPLSGSQKESEGYNYYDLRNVHELDSGESSDDDNDAAAGGADGGESNYVDNIDLAKLDPDSPLPSGYALPESGEWKSKPQPPKRSSKQEGTALSDKTSNSPKTKGLGIRQSGKRGNRWEIEFEELEIDKRIGQGAYGSVFKGKWRNTVVAIKTIRENMASFHEAKFKEFRAEAEMMMDMRPHTNVVQLFGVCMRPYMAIVVEFLEGGSLQELLQSKAEIDLHTALKIALHAAAGVAHLHAEGICHRDLAARNLLLTSRNKEYLVVKVADFGLSRFTEDAEDNFTSCKVGPLKWMPPESLQEQKYSYKSDAWSMGVVLWEIFSRQVAIGVSSRGMCLRPPSACPPAIAQLMYDCWAYDPRERPDFRTIARTIEQVLDSNPTNYNVIQNAGEPISCTHPKSLAASTKPTPPPRSSTGS